jgi:hypothetical protein
MRTANRADAPRRSSEILFEFSAIGNSIKVCAVDPVTMREVSIIGPVTAGEGALKRAAVQKLRYVLDGPRVVTVNGRRSGVTA